jgi:hypothetical protein
MIRFDKIIEEWAIKYKPMQHVPGPNSRNKRFFYIDSIVQLSQFMAGAPNTGTPCVVYEFQQNGYFGKGLQSPVYNVYFPVRVPTMKLPLKELANEAVNESMRHAEKFLAWLRQQQREDRDGFQNLELDNVEYDTFGPFLDNWYAVFIQIRDIGQYPVCVLAEDYLTDEEVAAVTGQGKQE